MITVTGELDLATSPALDRELKRAEASDAELVVLDLGELVFIDSTGLGVLVKAHGRAASGGPRFALVKGSPQVHQVMSITGLLQRLTVADSLDDLLAET